MRMYIKSIVALSAQETFENNHLPHHINTSSQWLGCINPEFKKYIPAKVLRRMNRMNRLCLVAASQTMSGAQLLTPDAIITATSNGCMEDSESFLNQILDNDEKLLTPTSFIQSTHNAVGSNLALAYQCKGYNMVYTQQTSAFEAALLDAVLRLQTDKIDHVLVGASDEITAENYRLKKKEGRWKCSGEDNLELLKSSTPGAIPGEGAVFMLVTKDKKGAELELKGVDLFYRLPHNMRIIEKITSFLQRHGERIDAIDTFLLGIDGDANYRKIYDDLLSELPEKSNIAYYKHLCGDYDTDGAFAVWVASRLVNESENSDDVFIRNTNRKTKKVLVIKQGRGKNYSFVLLNSIIE